jgi:hypothetical protein
MISTDAAPLAGQMVLNGLPATRTTLLPRDLLKVARMRMACHA